MKKYLFIICLAGSMEALAQVPEDAIKYSWYPQNGTARNQAIGGAMGSLGGDITATFVNPAGLGFYKTQEFVFTPSFSFINNKVDYRGTNSTNNRNVLTVGPIGWVFGMGDNIKKKQSSAFSIAFTQTANLNNIVQYKGYNNLSSFSEQFAEEFAAANQQYNISIDDVLNQNSPLPYTAAPALYTYLIDTVTMGNQLVVRAAPENILDAGQALLQEYRRKTSGGLYELAFGGAVNDNDKWLFGASMGVPIVDYASNTNFKERDTSSNNLNGFRAFDYTDDYVTRGIGLNLKLGAIFRPKEYIRIGIAVHTPSFMWLQDERTTTLRTEIEGPSGNVTNYDVSSTTFTNDQPGKSKYMQMAPWKAMLSASYVFRETENTTRQKGFLTADVEYVNHKGSRFHDTNKESSTLSEDYKKQLNDVIRNTYKGAFNFRVGGELKFNIIMARLGFAYYGDPYRDAPYKASKMLASGGIGYRNKGFFIDLTYVQNITKDANMPYVLSGQDNTFATTKVQQSNVVATLGWKF